ncbi:MAG: 2-C-methyl-D-erythritol 4-phosphate cytidylyltransferase [Chlorobiota bacterium]|nr:2-C-methyl-D-erythritol 4-phosphate cytidylyltransferase [Chlorobiota bacterium]QQS66183.1 MAG: 2-C-methyl-D-erythritol 4-phosphate cytidylyltransferase [Chlorobiota bacterium]
MISLIIPSAGIGKRTGSTIPKQFVQIHGLPVIAHTVAAFIGIVDEVIISVDSEWLIFIEDWLEQYKIYFQSIKYVIGGSERQYSIANAINSLDEKCSIVLVHDAARPNPSKELILEVINKASIYDGASPGLIPADTIKKVVNGLSIETLKRDELRATQTPQGFKVEVLKAAYNKALKDEYLGTDDASLVEANGGKIFITLGESSNIKITYPIDFIVAELILKNKSID